MINCIFPFTVNTQELGRYQFSVNYTLRYWSWSRGDDTFCSKPESEPRETFTRSRSRPKLSQLRIPDKDWRTWCRILMLLPSCSEDEHRGPTHPEARQSRQTRRFWPAHVRQESSGRTASRTWWIPHYQQPDVESPLTHNPRAAVSTHYVLQLSLCRRGWSHRRCVVGRAKRRTSAVSAFGIIVVPCVTAGSRLWCYCSVCNCSLLPLVEVPTSTLQFLVISTVYTSGRRRSLPWLCGAASTPRQHVFTADLMGRGATYLLRCELELHDRQFTLRSALGHGPRGSQALLEPRLTSV